MKQSLAFFLLVGLIFISCKESSHKDNPIEQKVDNETSKAPQIDSSTVYKSENLIIKKLSDHIYVHTSFLNTDDFGKVPCNGMLVINENEGVVFDTPTDNKSSLELINFINNDLKCKIAAIIPTHFHNDCLGGIEEFEAHNTPMYVTNRTIEILKKNGQKLSKPINEFDDKLTLDIGSKKVYAEYFGEGHTTDNIVGYFPDDHAVFGGCLIKEIGASRGYLGDSNIKDWSETVEKVKLKYPNAEIVIPGHGEWGDTELFDYTIELFK